MHRPRALWFPDGHGLHVRGNGRGAFARLVPGDSQAAGTVPFEAHAADGLLRAPAVRKAGPAGAAQPNHAVRCVRQRSHTYQVMACAPLYTSHPASKRSSGFARTQKRQLNLHHAAKHAPKRRALPFLRRTRRVKRWQQSATSFPRRRQSISDLGTRLYMGPCLHGADAVAYLNRRIQVEAFHCPSGSGRPCGQDEARPPRFRIAPQGVPGRRPRGYCLCPPGPPLGGCF